MTTYHLISHTHWDREWYLSLEQMKLRLCDLMDHCLAILQTQPDYIFHLDAQTVVLEDYLAIRPQNRSLLEKYIREKRLMVGPWYLQNDFYLSSGEATIRNLLEGRRLAGEFGHCDNVGYAPDQFGNISQLPQILRGFGIDNFIFGRGLWPQQPDGSHTPTEMIWEGPDESKVLAVHLRYWYNNAQHISPDANSAAALLEGTKARFQGIAGTDHLLLMNGVDHLEPQPDVLFNLEAAAGLLQEGETVKQTRLSEYTSMLREAYSENPLSFLHKGQLRQGEDTSILKGTLSSRAYLKAANVKAQTMLENVLEPLYSMLELSGMKGAYSQDHFRFLWKQLLRNLPHDSICGCSNDLVHKHMEDNYGRLATYCQDMKNRAMQLAAAHLELPGRTDKNYIIILANTTQLPCATVTEVDVDIPMEEDLGSIMIRDGEGNMVPFVILSTRKTVHDCFSPLNLPGKIPVMRYRVSLKTGDVAPFAFKGFVVEPAAPAEKNTEAAAPVLENEFYKVTVGNDGCVSIYDKRMDASMENVLDVEDLADCGDSYCYFPEKGGKAIYASSFPATVTVDRWDDLMQQVSIRRAMELPRCYDFENRRRSPELVSVPVTLTLRLKAGEPRLEVNTQIDNKAEDHRMRLLVRTSIPGNMSAADTPFDIIRTVTGELTRGSYSNTFPNSTFAALEGEERSLAVMTEGAQEYEHIPAQTRLAFTLVRSTGVILRNYDTLIHSGGDQWTCPENQCLRKMESRFAIQSFRGSVEENNLIAQSNAFRAGLPSFYISSDEKRFMRGRAVVQSSGVDAFYYLPDPYANIRIRNNCPQLKLEGNLTVTALKKQEQGDEVVLRVLNIQKTEERLNVCDGKFEQLRLDETPVEDKNQIVKPYQLTTVLIHK